MKKNETRNVFKYAFGEIILVVLGILIAIQLNEWRLESSNNNQKKIILKALQLEFQANIRQLDTVIYYNEKVPEAYFLANEMIKKTAKKYTINEYHKLIMGLSWTYTFNPSNGALRSAISSSEIHLIHSKRLIEILFSWEDAIKDSEEEALTVRKFQYKSFAMKGKYISAADDWKALFPEILPPNNNSNYKSLLKDKEFEDYSILSYAYAKEYLVELNEIRNKNLEILFLIKKALKT
jgi:hypothetical protein